MKNIVSFFKLKFFKKKKTIEKTSNVKKVLKIFQASLVLVLSMYIITLIVSVSIRNKAISKIYINIATNIRYKKENQFSLKSILRAYPLLNEKCYKVQKVMSKKATEDYINTFDVSRVDDENIKDLPVYSNYNNITVKDTDKYQRVHIGDTEITNYSSRKNINYVGLQSRNINLTKSSDKVLIYTTHTSESFKNSDRFKFDYSGTYRTRESKYNMLSVASILNERLIDKGISTVFNTTPHDYTSYTNAYTNSRKTIKNELDKNSRFGIAIDVHRDAYGDLNSSPSVLINGVKVAQVMIVLGIGTSGYENIHWESNISLALNIMREGNAMYKGLFRPLLIRNSKYNQDLNKGSILVEIGATGNTLEEVYYAARCFANVIAKIYK